MAEAWEDFGADETEAPAWESFGSQASGSSDFESFGDDSPVKKPMTSWDRRLKEAQGQRPGLDEDNEFGAPVYSDTGTYIPTPSNILRGGADLAARGLEYAAAAGNTFLDEVDEVYQNNGVADLPKLFGIDQQILPGTAIGALGEAFPLGGVEAGLLPGKMQVGKGDFLTPEVRAKLEGLYESGTPDEILTFARDNGATIDEATLREWVDYRNRENPVDVKPEYRSLEEEAEAFTPSREPTPEDLFGPEKTLSDDVPEFLREPINKTVTRSEDAEPAGPILARPEDLWPTEASKAADLAKTEANLLEEAKAFKGKEDVDPWEGFTKESTEPVETLDTVDLSPIQEKVTETISSWANAPEFEVVKSVNDIADEATRKAVAGNPNAKGFIGEDGKVRIIGDNVTPDEVPAIVFHEALGHHGMSQVFGEALDTKLTHIYDNAPWFKNKVDKWIADNPSAYVDSPNRVARAADEIFAKMSEDGEIARGKMKVLYDQIINTIKEYARKTGLKMEYSLREVESILAMAHNATVKGVTPSANGFATSPRFYGDYKKKSLTAEKMSTVGDIDDALDFIGSEAARTKEGPQTLAETRRLAEEYGFNMSSRYLRGQSLSEKKLAARIEGGKQALTQQVQDLLTLRKKMETQGMSPSILMDIQEKIGTAAAVYGRFDNDTAELGRSLRLLREVTESRKLGKEMARFMEEDGGKGLLADPDALIRFLDRLEEANKKGPAEAAKVLKETKTNKVSDFFGDLLNLPRSLMSTADLSAPLRQGISLVGTPQFWKGLPHMLKQFASEKHTNFIRDEIMSRPTYPLMEKAGIDITGGTNLAAREEAFINRWVSKIPLAKHSERAYTGFLNKLRADTFDSLVKSYEKAGIAITTDKKVLKDIGGYINNATGRGDLGKWSQAAPHLNSVFFSPRLIASRLNLLNPVYYTKLDPVVRKEAIKNLSSMTAIASTVITLAYLNGAEVETDPRSSDFAKIKTGNTRYDVLGGFGQYITLASRIATNKKKKLNGDIVTLGEGFKEDDFTDVLKDFGRNKLAPVPGFVVSSRVGTTPTGEEFVAKEEFTKLFMPMFARDVYDAVEEEGKGGAARVAPGLFGVGVQTFEGPRKRVLDEQGRDIDNPEVTEVSEELDRLNEVKKGALGYVGKKIKVDGVDKELTPEEHDDYQYVAGELLRQEMEPIINLPEWAELTEEEQLAILKSVRTRTRKDARDALFKGE